MPVQLDFCKMFFEIFLFTTLLKFSEQRFIAYTLSAEQSQIKPIATFKQTEGQAGLRPLCALNIFKNHQFQKLF